MTSILKKKRAGHFRLMAGSITGMADLDLYPREESLWKYVESEVEKRGPAGAILSLFHCLKKINKGDWVSSSSLIFGERNFFTERIDLIKESERLQETDLSLTSHDYQIGKGMTIEEINRLLIPDLMVALLEETPKKVRTNSALENMDTGTLREIGISIGLDVQQKSREEITQEIYNFEGQSPFVFQSQDIPNLDLTWPFYHKGELVVISRSHHIKKAWLGNLGTIPQIISNLTFSEWLGSSQRDKIPELWGEGDNIIPLLLPFKVKNSSGQINRNAWKKIHYLACENYRKELAARLPINFLRHVLIDRDYWYVIEEGASAFARKREKLLNLEDILYDAKYGSLDPEWEGKGLSPHEEIFIRNSMYLSSINDPELLAEYVTQMLTHEALEMDSILGTYSKTFRKISSYFPDFGLMIIVSKMAFESEASSLNPETVLSGYQRFSRELNFLLKMTGKTHRDFPSIKSEYPKKKEKRKIKFPSPNK